MLLPTAILLTSSFLIVGGVIPPGEEELVDNASPAHYNFRYSVADYSTGDVKGHEEAREGDVTRGVYTVLDPDGTLRRVEYSVEGPHGGFVAVVTKHPFHHSAQYQQEDVYTRRAQYARREQEARQQLAIQQLLAIQQQLIARRQELARLQLIYQHQVPQGVAEEQSHDQQEVPEEQSHDQQEVPEGRSHDQQEVPEGRLPLQHEPDQGQSPLQQILLKALREQRSSSVHPQTLVNHGEVASSTTPEPPAKDEPADRHKDN